MRDQYQWTAPSPLWAEAAGSRDRSVRAAMQRPALLRFATDAFMDDVLKLLENDPARLADLVARPETWRGPAPDVAPVEVAPKFALPLQRRRLAEARRGDLPAPAGVGVRELAGPFAGGGLEAFARPSSRFRRPRAGSLKLYQPAHQRYYLLSACLVCGRAGLPDRAVDPGREEAVAFVIRRLFPPGFVNSQTGEVDQRRDFPAFDETWEEFALVSDEGGVTGWTKVGGDDDSVGALAAGEERLPLFPLNYTEDDGRRRRLYAGLVPVGKREHYMGASSIQFARAISAKGAGGAGGASAAAGAEPFDQRMMALWLDVTEPWKVLLQRADAARRLQEPKSWPPGAPEPIDDEMEPAAKAASIKATRELIQTGSWYVLLDFAKFLEENLTDVWAALTSPSASLARAEAALGFGTPQRRVYDVLRSSALASWRRTTLGVATAGRYPVARIPVNLAQALSAVAQPRADGETPEDLLESAQAPLDLANVINERPVADPAWPDFLFPLAHAEMTASDVSLGPVPNLAPPGAGDGSALAAAQGSIDALADLIKSALTAPAKPPASVPLAAQKPMDTREGFFRLRCVYLRPLCGPFDPPLVSEPTREFQMAGFFDPDAPARPIRIALPIDTSPGGLRKFDKNTAFQISDMLCGQIERMKAISLGDLVRSVLPWPLHKDLSVPSGGGGACTSSGFPAGMLCSLSIPIITICALILLMIIVSLLDIIFRWMPFFLICFPLPGFGSKSKRAGG